MTQEKLSYREKREKLNRIFREMCVPRHLFYALAEAEKFLDENSPYYHEAKELIGELKPNDNKNLLEV